MPFVILDIETVPDPRWERPADKPDAFPPTWAHRIVCVGTVTLDDMYRVTRSGTLVGGEATILEQVARGMGASRPTIVTYNGRSFDLPVIMQRSLIHRVPQPWFYDDREMRIRWSTQRHVDVCDQIAEQGAVKSVTLDAIAKACGLEGKRGVDGASVEAMFAAGKLDEIREYCLDDVRQTALLFLRAWFLRGHLTASELATSEQLIADHFAAKAEGI